jgi:hypothetical protein
MRLIIPALCLLLMRAATVMAQSPVHHCVGPDGSPVFTDQPCFALQATPVQPAAAAAGPAPNRPAPILCAASVEQLRKSVIEAFAQRDANRMAGLMLWEGYGNAAVVADIRLLSSMMQHPLLDVTVSGATRTVSTAELPPLAEESSPPGSPPAPPASGNRLVVQTAGFNDDGSPGELHLDIVHRAGCLWLRPPD